MFKIFKQIAFLTLLIILAVAPLFPVITQVSEVDLDSRNGYYSGWVEVVVGRTTYFYVSIRQYNIVQISIAPTKAPVDVTIRDPENKIVKSITFNEKRSIQLNIDLKGRWVFEFTSLADQIVYIEISAVTQASTAYMPPPPPAFPLEYIVAIIGGAVVLAVAMVGVFILRKKPAPPTTPPAPSQARPTPTAPATPATSGETVLLEGRPSIVGKETEIMFASLELPDGRVIAITSPRQIFGRADFERYLSPEVLSYISRRHFMITLEPGGFFIEDLGSANGTTVNDTDIRGKGKVLLKPGDVIGVGGVVKLRFRTAG